MNLNRFFHKVRILKYRVSNPEYTIKYIYLDLSIVLFFILVYDLVARRLPVPQTLSSVTLHLTTRASGGSLGQSELKGWKCLRIQHWTRSQSYISASSVII